MENHTPETIAVDLEYHIRYIERLAAISAATPAISIGTRGCLLRAAKELERARASLLDGLDRL